LDDSPIVQEKDSRFKQRCFDFFPITVEV